MMLVLSCRLPGFSGCSRTAAAPIPPPTYPRSDLGSPGDLSNLPGAALIHDDALRLDRLRRFTGLEVVRHGVDDLRADETRLDRERCGQLAVLHILEGGAVAVDSDGQEWVVRLGGRLRRALRHRVAAAEDEVQTRITLQPVPRG